MQPTVVLPTYNEHENLEPMVRALGEHGVRVLVIDDNSPDGTGELADRLAAELDYVEVLHRERKEGLGRAYIAGFRRALATDAELILEMDCDFSHDPADVPRLIAAADDADLVLGSRYVPGGGDTELGGDRAGSSRRAASLYARLLLMPRARPDRRLQVLPSPGPRGDRPRRDRRLAATHSRSSSTYRARRKGFRVVEVPIVFADREVGHSKMSRVIVARGRLEGAAGCACAACSAACSLTACRTSPTANFDEVVLRAERPVVVDFWAPWCGPCHAVTPILEKLSGELDSVEFVKLDIDANPATASRYGVLSIPTVTVFSGGEAARDARRRTAALAVREDPRGVSLGR